MPTAISTRTIQLPELRKRISQASHEDRAAAAHRLQAAKERISNPVNWTQFTAARDASGKPVHTRHQNACQWCASASLTYQPAPSGNIANLARYALVIACAQHGFGTIPDMNDAPGTQHADVMEVFDDAISLLE